MARQLRIEYPNAVYHVLSRGNERREIFEDDDDRKIFLENLKTNIEENSILLIAYCMMDNHFHLIVETPKANLSRFMHRFNVTYTIRFNQKHRRSGHLFQGRYKAILVEAKNYLLKLSRYIHLNPIRTVEWKDKKVEEKRKYLQDYQWSSLRGYCGYSKQEEWIFYERVLATLDGNNNSKKGQREYWRFVQEGIIDEAKNPFEEVWSQIILGGDDFIEKIKEKYLKTDKDSRELPSLRRLKNKLSINDVLSEIGKIEGEKIEDILSRQGGQRRSRQIAMELCYRYAGLSQEKIGKEFGGIDYSTVSYGRRRLKIKMEKDEELVKKFRKIEEALISKCQE